ncbi:MAG: BNR/Asp-box repeat protein, partial [Cytophagaceae bacterium]|nr:BNR/Asp-box repeat protein [Cytophagaceae bacterium]
DLSENADVILEIQNIGETFNFITVELEDIDGVKASYEPNVTDLTEESTWEDASQPRKSLNGVSFDENDNDAHTFHIDLTNGGENVGGLTGGISNCGPGPYNCPATSYAIDITKIKTVIFTVNFGADNIFVSGADGDHLIDRFIPGNTITPYTGGYILSDFKIGTFIVTSNQSSVDNNKLVVYPNPAKDLLNVSYEAANGAEITLTDMVGNKVLSTSASAGITKAELNTSGLQNGIYILNISTEKGKTARKVSIQ